MSKTTREILTMVGTILAMGALFYLLAWWVVS